MDTEEFIRRLPKTETHLHIEGAVPFSLLQRLDPERFREDLDWRDLNYRFPDFGAFEAVLFPAALAWYTSAERYHEAAKVIFADHLARNVRYVETSFHSGIIPMIKVPGKEIVDAILSAVPEGVTVRLFMGMTRKAVDEGLADVLDEALQWDGLAGIDLHGVESLPLAPWAVDYWARARAAGKTVKAHAGEFGPAASVREVVDRLGVRRVQHGTRAMEDPDLVERLKDEGVTLDMCPISNLKLGVVSELSRHPIRELFDAGVRVTVSTDDPVVFANTIEDEYRALAGEVGFSREELAQVARNGFAVAEMAEPERQAVFDEIATVGEK